MTLPMGALGLLTEIEVRVTVELGAATMRLREICDLAEDSTIMLDRLTDEPLDLLVNGKPVARGEVVAEGNRFGLRIIELIGQDGAGHQDQGLTETRASASPSSRATPAGAERRAAPPIVEGM